jgi:hypothetical protein
VRTYPIIAWTIWRDAEDAHTPAGTSRARIKLGRALYWTGVTFGVLLGLGLATLAWTPADPRPAGVGAGIGFLLPFLTGRAARYVLAGE